MENSESNNIHRDFDGKVAIFTGAASGIGSYQACCSTGRERRGRRFFGVRQGKLLGGSIVMADGDMSVVIQ